MKIYFHRLLISTLSLVIVGATNLSATAPLVPNLSSRSNLSGVSDALIIGFVVKSSNTEVLLRAIGPSLSQFGVTTPLADPILSLYDASGILIVRSAVYDQPLDFLFDPTGQIRLAESRSGAFQFSRAPLTNDQAILSPPLAAGAYTLHITSRSGGKGTVLGEVYFQELRIITPIETPD